MHKSGAQKRLERRKREETAEKGKISLFEMGITSHKWNTDNSYHDNSYHDNSYPTIRTNDNSYNL